MEGASKLFPCSSSYHPSHLPATNKATSQPGVRAISSHPYPAAQGRLRPVALGWLFDVHKAKEVFAAEGDEVCRGSGSCWDVTPQPHADLPLQHSSLEAPAHQPETCCRCCAPRSGCSCTPKAWWARLFAPYQDADLHCAFRSVLANHALVAQEIWRAHRVARAL